MPMVVFTSNLQRHVACPEMQVAGSSVREVLDNVFAANPRARGYVLDEHAALRRHMIVFIDGQVLRDRRGLTDAVRDGSTLYVFQALSGG
jgi:ThiS family.